MGHVQILLGEREKRRRIKLLLFLLLILYYIVNFNYFSTTRNKWRTYKINKQTNKQINIIILLYTLHVQVASNLTNWILICVQMPLSMYIMVQNGRFYCSKWLSKCKIRQNFNPPKLPSATCTCITTVL